MSFDKIWNNFYLDHNLGIPFWVKYIPIPAAANNIYLNFCPKPSYVIPPTFSKKVMVFFFESVYGANRLLRG